MVEPSIQRFRRRGLLPSPVSRTRLTRLPKTFTRGFGSFASAFRLSFRIRWQTISWWRHHRRKRSVHAAVRCCPVVRKPPRAWKWPVSPVRH